MASVVGERLRLAITENLNLKVLSFAFALVLYAMVHGGPFPATSDGRSTSVGTLAIDRFLRPVCYQDIPDALLPAELRGEGEAGLPKRVDGTMIVGAR